MPRAGLTPTAVVDTALDIVDTDGMDALTLTAVAQRSGVAVPSLYKHIRNLTDLRRLIRLHVMQEMTERLRAATIGRSADDAVRALMYAYRDYVTEQPRRYAALPAVREPDPELAIAMAELLDVVLAVLRGYGLSGSAAIHAARVLRAAAHGFASLEVADGFGLPEELDVSYGRLVDAVVLGLHAGGW